MRTTINKTFTYSSDDDSVNYEVIFIQGFPLKFTHLGKTWAKRTQCVIKYNGFIIAYNYITKHEKDKDNIRYAYMNCFNPIKHEIMECARLDIIKEILLYTNQKHG